MKGMDSLDEQVNSGLQGGMTAPKPQRRNAAATRARILLAARRLFSEHGYAHAGIRDIAAAAGVNGALAIRYFGGKERLFEEALSAELGAARLWQGDRSSFGRDLAAMLIEGDGAANPLPMLILSFTDPVARQVSLGIIERELLAPLAAYLGGANAEARAAEVLALTAGFSTYRRLLPLRPFTGTADESARRWLERSLQAIADGRTT
jgi:AcrR family transcriptional regulator